ncbi:unnamed protein product [Peronospora belbahrii]|uniref:Transcription factor IIIC subunit 5 HTH domain-containing protein n=1 Tax=Peronospora belbahrii TaxID=622444 RepID=A0AAU9KUC6_9STRA|nr:unnamed protein product [Peronospora belbahrii]CAH0516550.1 unnamed protein product [Peronospora belbahrii]
MVDKQPCEDIHTTLKTTIVESSSNSIVTNSKDKCLSRLCHELSLHSDNVRPLMGLELPVYGTDMTKVLETVNGLESLQQAHEAKSQLLPVKLRPEEPSCKPLFADLTKTQMVLLKVKRSQSKRKRNETEVEEKKDEINETEISSEDIVTFSAEVVGLVKEKYVCEGMADFQYFTARSFYPKLKPNKDAVTLVAEATDAVDTPVMNSAVVENGPLSRPSLRQRELQDCLRPYLAVENETQLELIPEVFSKVDLPLKYEFRQKSGYQPTAVAKKSSTTMTCLNFHDDTPAPAGPKPERPVMRRRSVGVSDDGVDAHVMEVLEGKLAQKPVWLRSKLFDGLDGFERRAARRLLRKLCYVFVDGPWRGSWIKMGYDPRLPEVSETASCYQVVELRNNRELVHSKVTHAVRKRTKKFAVANVGNANGDGGHAKGPRIVKVTQTSALENAQICKRRRKERFTRSETRRSYLVEPNTPVRTSATATTVASLPRASPASSTVDSGNEWDSEDEQEDKESIDNASRSTNTAALGGSEKSFEIFGVPLTSANVLFQLEEIDDNEVREWTALFAKQLEPSLLGGWYPTQMFLPLREIIRLRIAALVGRSKAELETRRKHLDALKKQALNDYAECAGSASSQQKSSKIEHTSGSGAGSNSTEAVADDEEVLAFERSLIQNQDAQSNVEKLSAGTEIEKGEEDDEEDDLELQEDEDANNDNNTGRFLATNDEDENLEDDEEEDEQVEDIGILDDKQEQQKEALISTCENVESTEYSF